jgi:hypothetical protein
MPHPVSSHTQICQGALGKEYIWLRATYSNPPLPLMLNWILTYGVPYYQPR